MRYIFSFLFISFLLPFSAVSQKLAYKKEMQNFYAAVQKHFFLPQENYYKENAVRNPKDKNDYSYLWGLCAMFEALNETGKITKDYKPFNNVFSIVQKYHSNEYPVPGYASYANESRFYDDNQWIGITAMNAYERTKNKKWLAVGKEIYRFMMSGFDTVTGGGIYWKEHDHSTKNTCSNGPGILLALQLFNATKEKTYLDTALQLYEWTNKHLRTPDGLYWDNINTKTSKIDTRRYSYNSGTMLQSNVYLYEITGDKKYLTEAQFIAKNAVNHFYGKQRFIDNYWFNAVMLRGLVQLYKHDKNNEHLKAFETAVQHALTNNKNELGLMGIEKTADLVGQGGMLEMLARFALLQSEAVL